MVFLAAYQCLVFLAAFKGRAFLIAYQCMVFLVAWQYNGIPRSLPIKDFPESLLVTGIPGT
jgi:hypothetical protein